MKIEEIFGGKPSFFKLEFAFLATIYFLSLQAFQILPELAII